MMFILHRFMYLLLVLTLIACAGIQMKTSPSSAPEFLYKIMSNSDWQASKGHSDLKLTSMDDAFIHLAQKDQLDRILDKFWGKSVDVVILKLEPSKLRGQLVLEKNPGGNTEFWHLYGGSITLNAVVKVLSRSELR
jgi:uncharacterized protein (DUF952 family)